MDGEAQSIASVDGLTPFREEAAQVLGSLRRSVADVLSTVGMRRPGELQKLCRLDWTLSWQLFQVAGGSGGEPVCAGHNVPSRTSLNKFLTAAASHGVVETQVDRVWRDYAQFERLVEKHAGDRTSFNSMVSAANGLDAEWAAADLQHRRNAFRSMSHITGMQARTKVICGIFNEVDRVDASGGSGGGGGKSWDMCVCVGFVGLRLLRPLPAYTVFRMRITDPQSRSQVTREPLALNEAGRGYFLERFSSQPTPRLAMSETEAGWLVGSVEGRDVGNQGATTTMFGTVFRNHPVPHGADASFKGDVFLDKPVEVVISDALVRPGMMREVKPRAAVFMGNGMSDVPAAPGDIIPIEGDFRVEYLGRGPKALATPDVPNYADMIQAAGERVGWPIDTFEAWRIRIEFPVYQTTVRMKWDLPREA